LFEASEPGVATIVARKDVGLATTGGVSATYEYVADVHPDGDDQPFRATFKEHFSGQFRDKGIRRPAVGEKARVTFSPMRHKVEFDRKALREERDLKKKASDAAFDTLANSPPEPDVDR
jgi:hypothetical protein